MQPSSELLLNRCNKHIPIRGVIHIGAGKCEERFDYRELCATKVLWIDGTPQFSISGLIADGFVNDTIVECYLSDTNGVGTIHHTAIDSRNDSLALPTGAQDEVIVRDKRPVPVKRLDSLLNEFEIDVRDFNTMVIDVQGWELKVFAGCGTILDQMEFIVTECWLDQKRTDLTPRYEVQPTIEQMQEFLQSCGLHKTLCAYQSPTSGKDMVITNDTEVLPRNIAAVDILTERGPNKYIPRVDTLPDKYREKIIEPTVSSPEFALVIPDPKPVIPDPPPTGMAPIKW